MTHPTDEELDALVKRATVIDPLLEVDFDTQRDVAQDPYGAWEAIETALYLIRDKTAALTALRAQLAEVRALADALELAANRLHRCAMDHDHDRPTLLYASHLHKRSLRTVRDCPAETPAYLGGAEQQEGEDDLGSQ